MPSILCHQFCHQMQKKHQVGLCNYTCQIRPKIPNLHDKSIKQASIGSIKNSNMTGNNPMVGMTVSVAVAVEESLK